MKTILARTLHVVALASKQSLHVVALAWKRFREILATWGIEETELISAFAAIGYWIVLALPGDYLQSQPALSELEHHAAEWVYATIMFLLGVYQLVACLLGGLPPSLVKSPITPSLWLIARLYGLRAGVTVWVTLDILLFQGRGYLGVVFCSIITGCCVIGSYRVAKNIVADQEAATMRFIAAKEAEAEAGQTATTQAARLAPAP